MSCLQRKKQVPDQSQRVVWSIDHKCPIRDRSAQQTPIQVEAAVGPIVEYEQALRGASDRDELVGDIVVTSVRSLSDPFQFAAERKLNFPDRGWNVKEELAAWGGANGVFSLCGECPANPGRLRLGACSGSLDMDPDSRALNELLQGSLESCGLEELHRSFFVPTVPLWYGLWIRRELEGEAQLALRQILEGLLEQGEVAEECLDHRGIRRLIEALDHAAVSGLTMQIELLAPGRQVLDLMNTFPHCPHCRASALDQVWQRPYPTSLQACSVCGSKFSPAETVSATRVWDLSRSLYDELGCLQYRELLQQYLGRRGIQGADLISIQKRVEKTIEDERSFRLRLDALRKRRHRYLETHVFFGLKSVPPPPSGVLNDPDETSEDEQTWFRADEFEALLNRVVSLGLTVRYMTHMGGEATLERHAWEGIDDPLHVFEQWKASGCQSKFSALLLVPQSVLGEEDS